MAEVEIAKLRRQRAVIKGACTRISNFADTCTDLTPQLAIQLASRLNSLEKYWQDYNLVQSQLEDLDDEDENRDRPAFENAFYKLQARVKHKLDSYGTSSAAPGAQSVGPGAPQAANSPLGIRLPKLNLPTFSGKYEEWFPFRDSFNSLIHTNNSLSNVQKLQYLRASLSGLAADVIASLETSDANYQIAWSSLTDRYDKKQIIVSAHVEAIMRLPSMAKENAAQLRQITDGVTKHINALAALKCPTDYWDVLLIHIISAKIDPTTAREWHASLTSPELPNFKDFINFVKHRCETLEATAGHSLLSSDAGNAQRVQGPNRTTNSRT